MEHGDHSEGSKSFLTPSLGAASAASPGAPRLVALQANARERRNAFAGLMKTAKTHSLGQISLALYHVGGEYRRNM